VSFFAILGREAGSPKEGRDTITWSLHSSLSSHHNHPPLPSSSSSIVVSKGWIHCKRAVLNLFAAFHHLCRSLCDRSTTEPQSTSSASITASTVARCLLDWDTKVASLSQGESLEREYISGAVTSLDTVRSSSSVSFHSDLTPKLEPSHIIARHTFPPTSSHPPRI